MVEGGEECLVVVGDQLLGTVDNYDVPVSQ